MNTVTEIISDAQAKLRRLLLDIDQDGGLTRERYVRFLSMQHHLTRGVQRHFLMAASHPDLARRRKLRAFLVRFANEEELHFEIARDDLARVDSDVLPKPLDVTLWWTYFDSIIASRPFVRLGATCILENISDGSEDVIGRLVSKATYLNRENTRFLTIHRHQGDVAHGAEILEALADAQLEPRHFDDLAEGARNATILYCRMIGWTLKG